MDAMDQETGLTGVVQGAKRTYSTEQLLFFRFNSTRPSDLPEGKYLLGVPWDSSEDKDKRSKGGADWFLPSHIIPGHEEDDTMPAMGDLLRHLSICSPAASSTPGSSLSSGRPSATGFNASARTSSCSSSRLSVEGTASIWDAITPHAALASQPCGNPGDPNSTATATTGDGWGRASLDDAVAAGAATAGQPQDSLPPLPPPAALPPLRLRQLIPDDTSASPGRSGAKPASPGQPGTPGSEPTPRRPRQALPAGALASTPRTRTPRLQPPPGLQHAEPAFIQQQLDLLGKHRDDPAAAGAAAHKLTELASSSIKDAQCIAELGGVGQLLKLLSNSNTALQQAGLDCVSVLVGCRVDAAFSRLVLDGIAAAAPRLARALGSKLSPLQHRAACLLRDLATSQAATADHARQVVDAGAIPMLVAALASGPSETAEVAAAVLQALAKAGEGNRQAINAAGAAPLLVPLLTTQKPGPQIAALDCLVTLLAGQPRVKAAVAEAGGLPLVCRLLTNPGLVCQAAAGTLQALCVGCLPNIQGAIEAGAIPSLVPMLRLIGQPGAQCNAACCIWALSAASVAVKEAFVRAGAVTGLLQLLTADNADSVRQMSAGAVWALVNGCGGAQQAVLLAGGLPRLADVLHSCPGDAQRNARGALLNLLNGCLCSPVVLARHLQPAVAGMVILMGPLVSGCPQLQAGAARALHQLLAHAPAGFVAHRAAFESGGAAAALGLLRELLLGPGLGCSVEAAEAAAAAAGILGELAVAGGPGVRDQIQALGPGPALKACVDSGWPGLRDTGSRAVRALAAGVVR